jgi:hypothetical protein
MWITPVYDDPGLRRENGGRLAEEEYVQSADRLLGNAQKRQFGPM